MTLCVAWRNKGDAGVHIASDSRISQIGGATSDFGIKILPIPISITEAGEEGSPVFNHVYGMGFAGSFLSAQAIREFLFIVLQRLCYVPGYTELSFESIFYLVRKFYIKLVGQLVSDLELDVYDVDFFFTGFCPKDRGFKCAKFFINDGLPICSILSEGEFISVVGGRKHEFSQLTEAQSGMDILRALQTIIDNLDFADVGGNIQYGSFNDSMNFTTKGIIRNKRGANGLVDAVQHCIAGIDMNGDEFSGNPGELFVLGEYITPFD